MPINYDIIKKEAIVMAVGSGIVTADEVLSHLKCLGEDCNYKSPMKKLVDYRNIERIDISSDQAETIASKKKTLKSKFANEKCAFISPEDHSFATIRVHQALMNGTDINTAVFRDYESAIEWLNIEIISR